jgi:lipopolysaccharide export system permease protein
MLYVFKEHFAPFVYAFCIITFLFIIDFLVRLLDAILSKGLDILVILEIFVLNIAWMLALSIPMACLVASLMAFGRLSGDNEIVAARSCGISPLKIMWPVLFTAVLICIGLIYFNNEVLPEANHRAASLRHDIMRKRAPAFINPRTLIKDFSDYRIWVDSIDYKQDLLFGVKIYVWEKRQPPRFMYASTARMEYVDYGRKILIHLMDGENHVVDTKDRNRYLRLKFKLQTVAIDNVDASLVRRERNYRSDREMSVEEMMEVVRRSEEQKEKHHKEYPARIFSDVYQLESLLQADTGLSIPPRLLKQDWWKTYPVGRVHYRRMRNYEKEKLYLANRYQKRITAEEKQASKYLVEVHKKFAIPVACIVFVLIGGPLGIMARRGGLVIGSIISIIFFLIYWVCFLGGEAMADRLIISPWLSMWAPNILVGIFGIFLLIRSVRIIR